MSEKTRPRGAHPSVAPLAGPVAALLGRPDISDAVLKEAVAERLAFEGRSGSDPEIVIEAARLRKRKAIDFLRKLVLPPPSAPLDMPIQPILRSHLRDRRR